MAPYVSQKAARLIAPAICGLYCTYVITDRFAYHEEKKTEKARVKKEAKEQALEEFTRDG